MHLPWEVPVQSTDPRDLLHPVDHCGIPVVPVSQVHGQKGQLFELLHVNTLQHFMEARRQDVLLDHSGLERC